MQRASFKTGASGIGVAQARWYGTIWDAPMSTPALEIFLSKSSIAENSPLGSVVGTFLLLDLLDTESLVLFDDAEGHFALDANYNLVVNGPLDFENESFQSIRVGLSNSTTTYEKTFLIAVENIE